MPAKPWILIVDDDNDVQQAMADLLAVNGYAVDVAANGADAINVLTRSEPPCAIIMDLLMPGIVGHELLEYLQSDPRLASIPVAIVSGSPQLAPGGHQVFRKPISAHALLDFVQGRC